MRLDPGFVKVWCELAHWAEEVSENSELAVSYFERALEIDPESDDALHGLALALANSNRLAEAIRVMEPP